MSRKKAKELFIFQKDGQDWGPFTLKELIEIALDGDVPRDTVLRNISTKKRINATSIPELASAIKKYEKRRAKELELQQVEADVTKLEQGNVRRRWIPVVVIALTLIALGVSAYFILSPAPRPKRFSPRLLFRDIDLTRLKPLAAGVVKSGQNHTHTKKGTHHYRRHVHLIHSWNAVTSMDLSSNSNNRKQDLTVDTIISVKNKLAGLVSRCAQREVGRNSGFRDARTNFSLDHAGVCKLTGLTSDSGVSIGFKRCLKKGALRVHFPAYTGVTKVITIPIKKN